MDFYLESRHRDLEDKPITKMRLTITAMLGLLATTALTSATPVNQVADVQLEARHLSNAAKSVQLEARAFKFKSPIGRPGRLVIKPVDENGNRRELTAEEAKEQKDARKFYGTVGGVSALALATGAVVLADNQQEKIRKAKGGPQKRAVDTEVPRQLEVRDPARTIRRPLGADGKPRPRTEQEKQDRRDKIKLVALGSVATGGLALAFGALAHDRIMKDKEKAHRERKDGKPEAAHPGAVRSIEARDPGPPPRKPFYIISKPVDEHGNPRDLTPEEERRRKKALGWGAFIGTVVTGLSVGLCINVRNNIVDEKKGYKRPVDSEATHQLEIRDAKQTLGSGP